MVAGSERGTQTDTKGKHFRTVIRMPMGRAHAGHAAWRHPDAAPCVASYRSPSRSTTRRHSLGLIVKGPNLCRHTFTCTCTTGEEHLLFFFRSGVTNTPRGGVVNCAQAKFRGMPFRSQRTLSAHPSPLGIGVPSSSMGGAPPSS